MPREFEKTVENTNTVQEAQIEAVVFRCGCGDPDSHNGKLCRCQGLGCQFCARVCPSPRLIEQRGVISYWHRSWWKRVWFRLFGKRA